MTVNDNSQRLYQLYDTAPIEAILRGGTNHGKRKQILFPEESHTFCVYKEMTWTYTIIDQIADEIIPIDDFIEVYEFTGSILDDGTRVYKLV